MVMGAILHNYMLRSAEDFRKKTRKSLRKHKELKPQKPNFSLKHKHKIAEAQHKNTIEEYWQKVDVYEAAIINDIFPGPTNTEHTILKEEVDVFAEQFQDYLKLREYYLQIYAQARVKQIESLEHNSNLEKRSKLIVHARNLETGKVKTKTTPTDGFLLEHIIRQEIRESYDRIYDSELFELYTKDYMKEYATSMSNKEFILNKEKLRKKAMKQLLDESYIPRFKSASTKPKIEILYAQNVYEFFRPGKKAGDEEITYTLKFRVKSSHRELEKFVDWMTGIRPHFHYDSIGSIEIVPIHELYDSPGMIRKISDPKPFEIDYRNIPNKKSIGKLKELLHMGKALGDALMALPPDERKKKITEELKKEMLLGIWLDHSIGGLPIETILQTREAHELYLGPLGHDEFHLKNRDAERKKNLSKECIMYVTEALEEYFMPVYRLGFQESRLI